MTEVKDLPRDNRKTLGWVIDYSVLEDIANVATALEPVSMEQAEAVMLVMIDKGYAKLESEYKHDARRTENTQPD